MTDHAMTARQQREVAFYEQYAPRQQVDEVDMSPVAGRETRPWNPYWYVYQLAAEKLAPGCGRQLLEFGCGIGIAAVRLATLGYEVHGFDICPANIALARKLALRHGVADRCRFSVMAAERLEYPDQSFDVITGIDILHHIQIDQAINEAARVLKPGGTAIFKEHLAAPVIDPLRNTVLFKAIAPSDISLDHHITQDERKLTPQDLQTIGRAFDRMEVKKFTVVSRLDRLVPAAMGSVRTMMQKFDHALLRVCPPLAALGGTVVLTCHKRAVPAAAPLRRAA